MVWTPRVTVAAVVEQSGRYLLVEELADDAVVFNQPAGHLDADESLLDAVIREVLEETGRTFVPEAVTGVYLWTHPSGDTYLRVAFCGTVGDRRPGSILDTGIVDARWLTLDEIAALAAKHRSPLVMRCIDDYRAGARHSLELLQRLLPDGSRA